MLIIVSAPALYGFIRIVLSNNSGSYALNVPETLYIIGTISYLDSAPTGLGAPPNLATFFKISFAQIS